MTGANAPDVIDVGDLNVHLVFPIINKPGRGLPAQFAITYDSSVWQTFNGEFWVNSNAPQGGSNATLADNLGWNTNLYPETYSYSTTLNPCQVILNQKPQTLYISDYSDLAYFDANGTKHTFSTRASYNPCTNVTVPFPASTATDGSGFTSGGNPDALVVTNRSGVQECCTGVRQDTNGNQLSIIGAGSATGSSITDTLGLKAISASGTPSSGAVQYTYTDTTGTSQTVTVHYSQYTLQTNFQLSGVGEFGPTAGVYLPSSISYPDSESYQFIYEQTPGYPGSVTGRIASITLPKGGTISYSYHGGSSGIEPDGTTAGLSRITSDGTTTYTRAVNGATSTTTIQDAEQNITEETFVQASAASNQYTTSGSYLQTSSKRYTTSNNTPIRSSATCYNGTTTNCATASITLPVTEKHVATSLDNGLTAINDLFYNSYGLPTERDDYDFGASSPTRKTVISYASLGNNIFDHPASVTVSDDSGNVVSSTTYGYDETGITTTSGLPGHVAVTGARGNLTSVHSLISGSSYLTTTATYDDAGRVLASTSPNGTTNYGHESTDTFVTSTTPPTPWSGVSLPVSATTDVNTGLPSGITDPNGTRTSFIYNSMLRPTEIDNLDSSGNTVGKTTYSYTPTQSSVHQYQNASVYADAETLYDGYGRQSRVAKANGQSTNPWYQQDTCYDADGRVNFRSYRYQGAGFGAAKVCSGSGDAYSYDALGRVKTITHGDGTTIQYNYTGRATEVTDENGVSRITQVDGLGRTTFVCEISSNSLQGDSPSPCGLDISGTGFLTTYAYDLVNHKTTISQGVQQRVFQTDGLGRTIFTQEPERGQTTYSYVYNSMGLTVTRQRPQANQPNPSAITTTTTQYDQLGRILSATYSGETGVQTYTKHFYYDNPSGWGTISQANLKGRLSTVSTNTPTNWAGTSFSYDASGRTTTIVQCLPSGCGNGGRDRTLTFSDDWLSNLTTQTDPTAGTISYSYSLANEVLSVTGSNAYPGNPTNLVTSVQNGPSGPVSYSLGNGLETSFSYDSLGRRSGGWVCEGTTQNNCTGGTGVYGYTSNWNGVREVGGCDTVLNVCLGYGYDEFNRLNARSVTQGTAQNFSYVYDRYGNRYQQNVTAGSGPSFSASFNKVTNQINSGGYSYDAAGNMTSDGFHSYTYDAEGNITQVDGGSTVKYEYDALNHRVRVQTPSSTSEYTFDANGRPVTTWDATSNFGTQGQIYWGSSNVPVAYHGLNGTTYFEHLDWTDTLRMVTDYTGSSAGTFQSLPFGDGFSPSGDNESLNNFALLWHDTSSATDHAQLRQYSDGQGHWMSPDPYSGSYNFSNPQSFNRYAYVLNNPLSAVDPLGLDAAQECPADACTGASFNGLEPENDDLSDDPYAYIAEVATSSATASGLVANIQATLSVASMIGGPIGTGLNLVNAGISLYQGNMGAAGVYAATAAISFIPGGGLLGEFAEAGESLAAAESAASTPFAMGLDTELDAFAQARGATTWKQFANPENWKSGVLDKLADPNTPVHFNLNGVDVWSGVQRAASGGGGATDWELVQIMQNQQFWESTTFWQNGQIAPNPFQ